ncbi:MAG: hypothetical protein HQL52_19240, partial [Magnetococcales bacterium]|nr:hypothetical protein [Magnetococcales bacterium]
QPQEMTPVRVAGFQRWFNKPPTWRKGMGNQITVLQALPAPSHHLNALLVSVTDPEILWNLRRRERGYFQHRVPPEAITFDDPARSSPKRGSILIYTGKPSPHPAEILPNPDYLALCLAGASHWGKTFYQAFLQTTFVHHGQTLAHYTG